MATGLYTILSQLQVSKEEVLEAETFTKQYLRANFPDLDTREGLAIYDLVVRPTSSLVALINKGLSYYFSSNTISGINDNSPEDVVDAIMSNLFLTRSSGSSSIVRGRLYFLDKNRDIPITTSSTFSVDNVVFFKPAYDIVISAGEPTDSIPGNFMYDSSREEYYFDLDLISTSQIEDANQEGGDFLFFTNIDPYYVGGEILYLVQRAIPKETNSEFIERASSAISTRNLINLPSIDSAIKGTFNYINDVVVAGYGDTEMIRDTVKVPDITNMPGDEDVFDPQTVRYMKFGGKVDIYVDAPIAPQIPPEVELLSVPASTEVSPGVHQSVIYLNADLGNTSKIIYFLRRATEEELTAARINESFIELPEEYSFEYTCGQIVDDVFYEVGQYDANNTLIDVGFSSRQTLKITITGSFPLFEGVMTLPIRYWRFTGILGIQNYLDDVTTRVVCADYLARSTDIFMTDINVKRISNTTLTTAQLDKVKSILKTYFSNMRTGQELIVSNIVGALVRDSGVPDLDVNIGVGYTLYSKTFQSPSTGTITSSLDCERTQRFVLGEVTSIV